MVTVKEIYDYIDKIAPFSLQMSYDNSGLIIGNGRCEVKKIIVALDVTKDVVDEAIEVGADLIISHHPIIFRAVKKIDPEDLVGKLLRGGVSVICAHTSFDSAKGGMNDILCEKLGLVPKCELSVEEGIPCGYVCEVEKATAKELGEKIKEVLGCGVLRYNDTGAEIRTVGVCSGSGGNFLGDVFEKGCDAYISGDIKHDVFVDAYNAGVVVFDAGHFATEDIFVEFICEKISGKFPDVSCAVAKSDRDLLTYL